MTHLEYDNDEKNESNAIKNELFASNEPITINVGGIKYQTSITTLLGRSDSFFSAMFGGAFSLKPNKDGSYFIDRDGRHFIYILNFLRNGILEIPYNDDSEYLLNHLWNEAEFYSLSSLKFTILSKLQYIKPKINTFLLNKHIKFQFIMSNEYSKGLIVDDATVELKEMPEMPDFETMEGDPRCLFGIAITDRMCNKYDIYFRVIKFKSIIAFGYYASSIYNNNDWDGYLTETVWIEKNNGNIECDEGVLESTSGPQDGDTFGLSFDFIKNELKIYHNDYEINPIKLKYDNNYKAVIPAIVLCGEKDKVQILKYEFH